MLKQTFDLIYVYTVKFKYPTGSNWLVFLRIFKYYNIEKKVLFFSPFLSWNKIKIQHKLEVAMKNFFKKKLFLNFNMYCGWSKLQAISGMPIFKEDFSMTDHTISSSKTFYRYIFRHISNVVGKSSHS